MKVDSELQPFLVRDALRGLDALLAAQAIGAEIQCAYVAALIRLVVQSADAGGLPRAPLEPR